MLNKFYPLTIDYIGKSNRIITELGLTVGFDPKYPIDKKDSPMFSVQALWDTGATHSVITSKTVETMGLVPIGKATMNHAGGSSIVHTYIVNMYLPNLILIPCVEVTEANIQGFDAIIGMDIITQGDFSITNVNNQTKMSFRIPSISHIDYAKELNKPSQNTSSRRSSRRK